MTAKKLLHHYHLCLSIIIIIIVTLFYIVSYCTGAFLSLERRLYAVTENMKSIGICATLTRGVISSPLYIYIIDIGGTATYPGTNDHVMLAGYKCNYSFLVDYLFYDIRLQMSPYQNSTCATLYIVDDDTKESTYEEFYIIIIIIIKQLYSTYKIKRNTIQEIKKLREC